MIVARQTAALFLDAYRELNAKKLFWVSLVLSGIVVAAFATVGIDDRGWSIFWVSIPSFVNTTIIPREMFYKLVFSNYAIGFWLNWLAIILALISTVGIIPDFIAGGSVDLYLSKPVSRFRLFLTKFATGLLFVTLQVLIFTAACFVLIRLRAGVWDVRLFWAVVVVVLVFSYLFAVAALIGLLTRSTVAALLLTILFWLFLFGVSTAERLLFMGTVAARIETEAFNNQLAYNEKEIALLNQRVAGGKDSTAQASLTAAQARRAELEERKRSTDPTRRTVITAHRILSTVKAVLPKTADTNALLVRWLDVDDTELTEEQLQRREQRRAAAAGNNSGWFGGFRDRTRVRFEDTDVLREVIHRTNTLSASKVIGSSLAFEALTLALACWIFTRRDY